MKSVRALPLPGYQILILPLNLAAKPAPTPIGSTASFIGDWWGTADYDLQRRTIASPTFFIKGFKIPNKLFFYDFVRRLFLLTIALKQITHKII